MNARLFIIVEINCDTWLFFYNEVKLLLRCRNNYKLVFFIYGQFKRGIKGEKIDLSPIFLFLFVYSSILEKQKKYYFVFYYEKRLNKSFPSRGISIFICIKNCKTNLNPLIAITNPRKTITEQWTVK